jgi:hypothetical protein
VVRFLLSVVVLGIICSKDAIMVRQPSFPSFADPHEEEYHRSE